LTLQVCRPVHDDGDRRGFLRRRRSGAFGSDPVGQRTRPWASGPVWVQSRRVRERPWEQRTGPLGQRPSLGFSGPQGLRQETPSRQFDRAELPDRPSPPPPRRRSTERTHQLSQPAQDRRVRERPRGSADQTLGQRPSPGFRVGAFASDPGNSGPDPWASGPV
jgi:hypothetical protein